MCKIKEIRKTKKRYEFFQETKFCKGCTSNGHIGQNKSWSLHWFKLKIIALIFLVRIVIDAIKQRHNSSWVDFECRIVRVSVRFFQEKNYFGANELSAIISQMYSSNKAIKPRTIRGGATFFFFCFSHLLIGFNQLLFGVIQQNRQSAVNTATR